MNERINERKEGRKEQFYAVVNQINQKYIFFLPFVSKAFRLRAFSTETKNINKERMNEKQKSTVKCYSIVDDTL